MKDWIWSEKLELVVFELCTHGGHTHNKNLYGNDNSAIRSISMLNMKCTLILAFAEIRNVFYQNLNQTKKIKILKNVLEMMASKVLSLCKKLFQF
jgi:hypothetical protein